MRWMIAILVLANLLALAAVRGLFGPVPAAGPREPGRLDRQMAPGMLRITPPSAADRATRMR